MLLLLLAVLEGAIVLPLKLLDVGSSPLTTEIESAVVVGTKGGKLKL